MQVDKRKFIKSGAYAGILTVLLFSIFLLASLAIHKNFSFMKNSLSDLGRLGAKNSWVFNAGLIISGIFLFLFSISFFVEQVRLLKRICGIFLIISSILAIMIGLSPKGTPFHNPVSVVYYNIFMGATFIYGIDELRLKRYPPGLYSVLILPVGYLTYFLYTVIGFATAELGVAILLLLWVLFISVRMLKNE